MAGNGWTNASRNERGFSLLEAMIALSVLLVGIAGVAASFQAQISKAVSSRNQAQAAIIAQSVLTELSDTNPSGWDTQAISNGFRFDYDGNRVDNESDTYYSVTLSEPVKQSNWWNVTIGITWSGWRVEQEKAGYGNSNADFAYVLEASIAPYIPTDPSE